jgi:hypothetical protein
MRSPYLFAALRGTQPTHKNSDLERLAAAVPGLSHLAHSNRLEVSVFVSKIAHDEYTTTSEKSHISK